VSGSVLPDPAALDPAALEVPVSKLLGDDSVEILDARSVSIHRAFNSGTGGVYRVSGSASVRGEVSPWSLILKVARAAEGIFGSSDEPDRPNYWKREALLYRSELLEDIAGIRAPRCFGYAEHVGRTTWIWLEDVAHRGGSRWTDSGFSLAARRLGEFNAAYLGERTLPSGDGVLNRSGLRAFLDDITPAVDRMHDTPTYDACRRCWPGDLFDRIAGLWDERHAWLSALDSLPQTFCHLDAFSRNLLIDEPSQEVVAVDWSYAGIAPVGAELAPMVAASAFFFDVEHERMEAIDEVVFDAYLEGLQAGGEYCDAESVRFASTACAAFRYGVFPMGIVLAESATRTHIERAIGRPANEIAERWALITTFLLDRADEARRAHAGI
jgi:hypothetical protein